MVIKRLWRRMNIDELQAYAEGKVIKPLATSRTLASKNSFTEPLMCFWETANNAANWAIGLNLLDVVACFDIDEKFIIPGHGIYPLQKRFTTDKEIMDYWANLKAQPTILVKEYGMRQYSVKEAKLIDWGIVAYGKDFGRAIAMMRGEPIVCWDTYDDIYNGEPDIKVIKNSDTERSAAI